VKLTTISLQLLCVLATSCATRPVGVATGTLSTEQARAIQQTSDTATRLTRDNSLALWRAAVGERTHALVRGGHTDLNQVKALVCEQTAEEESEALQQRLAWSELLHSISAQTARKFTDGGTKNPTEEFSTQMKDALREMAEKSFMKSRDELIDKHYWEAVKKGSQQPAAQVQSEGAPSD